MTSILEENLLDEEELLGEVQHLVHWYIFNPDDVHTVCGEQDYKRNVPPNSAKCGNCLEAMHKRVCICGETLRTRE